MKLPLFAAQIFRLLWKSFSGKHHLTGFRIYLVGPQLSSWNAMLQRFALIQLTQGMMYFGEIYMREANSLCTLCIELQ
jgi:hypothetical protein